MKTSLEFSSATPAPKQTGILVKSFNTNDKKIICKESNMARSDISPEEMLALKTKLGMPWEKLKTIGRFGK